MSAQPNTALLSITINSGSGLAHLYETARRQSEIDKPVQQYYSFQPAKNLPMRNGGTRVAFAAIIAFGTQPAYGAPTVASGRSGPLASLTAPANRSAMQQIADHVANQLTRGTPSLTYRSQQTLAPDQAVIAQFLIVDAELARQPHHSSSCAGSLGTQSDINRQIDLRSALEQLANTFAQQTTPAGSKYEARCGVMNYFAAR